MLFGEKQELDQDSLAALKGLVERFGVVKERRAEISAEDSALVKEQEALQLKIQKVLDLAGLDGFEVPGVGKVYRVEKFFAKLPATESDWNALFEYLKKIDREDLITVNSSSLNSLYKEKTEEALEKGVSDFKMPGVTETGMKQTLSFRRSS